MDTMPHGYLFSKSLKETKDNPVIQAQAIKMSTDYEETQEQEESIDKDDDYDLDYN